MNRRRVVGGEKHLLLRRLESQLQFRQKSLKGSRQERTDDRWNRQELAVELDGFDDGVQVIGNGYRSIGEGGTRDTATSQDFVEFLLVLWCGRRRLPSDLSTDDPSRYRPRDRSVE